MIRINSIKRIRSTVVTVSLVLVSMITPQSALAVTVYDFSDVRYGFLFEVGTESQENDFLTLFNNNSGTATFDEVAGTLDIALALSGTTIALDANDDPTTTGTVNGSLTLQYTGLTLEKGANGEDFIIGLGSEVTSAGALNFTGNDGGLSIDSGFNIEGKGIPETELAGQSDYTEISGLVPAGDSLVFTLGNFDTFGNLVWGWVMSAGNSQVQINGLSFSVTGDGRGSFQEVPEPGTLALLSFGLLGGAAARRKNRTTEI